MNHKEQKLKIIFFLQNLYVHVGCNNLAYFNNIFIFKLQKIMVEQKRHQPETNNVNKGSMTHWIVICYNFTVTSCVTMVTVTSVNQTLTMTITMIWTSRTNINFV